MLTISKPLSAGQAQTYHAKEFTAAEQNYWKQGGEIEGEWHGKLAEQYGLAGAVGAKEFARLTEGQHPETGEQMVRHRKVEAYKSEDGKTVAPVEHRAGWDATFSAPKSISLTALVGGDDRVRVAHREAVNAALNELERYTHARIGGNNPAERTGKFIAAKFEHDTARPVDGYVAPQLHTHVVIFNMTERADGSTRALQEKALFESQQFATAIYQSQLTYQLRNLGYELETGKSGAPEIKGYSREYLDASSPRRMQIEEALARSGKTGAEASEIAAHTTRDKKAVRSPEEVLAAHQQMASKYGNQAHRIVQEARERALGLRQSEPRIPDVKLRAQDAVSYARDHNIERDAVTDERRLMRDALRRGMGDITYPQVRANFDARVAAGEFIAVPGHKHSTGQQFTTRDAIQAEKDVLKQMRQGQDQSPGVMAKEQATALADTRPHLNGSQRGVVEQVLTSQDQIQGLQGFAGTGKTTTLKVIREGAEANGYAVEGFAPTSRAARQLRDAGVSADTLQGFLGRGGQERAAGDPSNKHFYMVDESSLASTQQMRDFLAKIGPQDKVLLVGDTRQHQGVDAGKPFEDLQQAGMRTAVLDQIVRQRNEPGLLQVVQHLSRNETVAGVELLQQQGRVTEIKDPQLRVEAIAKNYAANPEGTIIVSPDNASRMEINQAVRKELQAGGTVSPTEQSVVVLTARSDMTGAARAWAAHYEPGDVLLYHRGSKELGIDRGAYTHVVSTDAKQNTVTVAKTDGEQVTYDPSRLRGVTTYREMDLPFAVGDRIQFTAPNKELGVANRDMGTIESIGKDGFTVRLLDTDKTVSFDPGKMPHIDHGYAVTSHSSQALTETRVLINIDTNMHPELLNTRLIYVAVSRAEMDAQVYTNDTSRLAEVLSRDVTKASALSTEQHQPSTHNQKEPAMSPDKREEIQPEQLPASIYAAQLPPKVIQNDIATIERGLNTQLNLQTELSEPRVQELAPPRDLGLESRDAAWGTIQAVVDEHWIRTPEQSADRGYSGATAAEEYATNLYQSVAKNPDLTPEQRIEQMQPTPEERQHWDPLLKAVPIEIADSFAWTGENGRVQSYQHESTHNYLHVDGATGQFYDRDKNPIEKEAALDHALPAEFSHGHRAEQAHQAPVELSM
jgi:conjugative relaxase-like TrwC/TraI family protein